MNKLSVAIPVYEFDGTGAEILEFSFHKLNLQTFKDFDVVISDSSPDNRIKNMCEHWYDRLNIKYFHSDHRTAPSNSNNALRLCESDVVKFLCADDFLFDDNSLKITYDNFDMNTIWMFTDYVHSNNRLSFYKRHVPFVNPNIIFENTLGTPSAMTMVNPNGLNVELFDENISYFYDCVWYFDMINRYGLPNIIHHVTMVNYLWNGSITSKMNHEKMNAEIQYILKKYS